MIRSPFVQVQATPPLSPGLLPDWARARASGPLSGDLRPTAGRVDRIGQAGGAQEKRIRPTGIWSTKVRHMRRVRRNRFVIMPVCLVVLSGGWMSAHSAPTQPADQDWPAWVDAEESQQQRIAAVNEGELVFLQEPPPRPVHHHRNRIVITRQSLADGWVLMEQCHERLDRVAEAQIVFNPGRTRALEVLSFHNMDMAFVESNTIQLRGIRAASKVCARLESQALHSLGMQIFELQNGPFMRRFLDGYYPLQLSIEVEYPAHLELVDYEPDDQPGYAVSPAPGLVAVEALFEGQLRTRFRFVAK